MESLQNLTSVQNITMKMSRSHIRRQRRKLAAYKAIAASSSARVLGDDSFFRDFLVSNRIPTAALAESVIARFLGKQASLFATECVKDAYRRVYDETKVAMCVHLGVTSPHECVASVVGPSNLFNFILATASQLNAELYTQRTGRPVLLAGAEGSLKVYHDAGCNAHGEADKLVDGNPAKKNLLRKLFKVKALKRKIMIARKNNQKARKKNSLFKLLSNQQARERKTKHKEPLVEDDVNDAIEEDYGEGTRQLDVTGDMYNSPASDTDVIFGEAKTEDLKPKFQSQAKEQIKAPNFSYAGYKSGEIAVEPEDIQRVMTLTGVSMSKAVKAIEVAQGDTGAAIIDLTE